MSAKIRDTTDTVLATVKKQLQKIRFLAVKRLCGYAVGVFAPALSCAFLTAWGGWTSFFLSAVLAQSA